ncbi:protein ubiquitination [Pleodorina starrii]|uniref:Protein ubiquitination n=1 Tax=Pleodorina starrii TaxID=330485 RepID=A0A9W6BRZ4_9CHLO|nr:protein ubiquitination [Pleodorina starrii]
MLGKSDQRGVGAVVYLAGMTSSGVPVGRIVERHLSLAKEQGATNGQPLFTPGARRGRGVGMGKGKISVELRVLLKGLQADVPGVAVDLRRVASHSLRRGGTTAAANAGVEEIKEHGRWRSSAVLVYVQRAVVAEWAWGRARSLWSCACCSRGSRRTCRAWQWTCGASPPTASGGAGPRRPPTPGSRRSRSTGGGARARY